MRQLIYHKRSVEQCFEKSQYLSFSNINVFKFEKQSTTAKVFGRQRHVTQ